MIADHHRDSSSLTVYVLAFPEDGNEAAAHKSSMLAIMLLVLTLVGSVVSLCLFIFLILKAARREIVLCDALVKQKESTQQAERKSMSKTNAFATYSHDLRASLTAITCLIELCREDVVPNSQLAANLSQLDTYVHDLLGLLNTVLDKSKTEAGKTELVEEEFNLEQVLEDVVDMYYPVGVKKGIDVIFDQCDFSIIKFRHVRGDRRRLKEILENLLSNAIKFTTEGHVVVRCIARKTSKENAIIASNRRSTLNCLSRLCYKNSGSLHSLDDIHTVHENPNCMEFVFEVDDTGCGIPKERRKSVFENYVQITVAAAGQQGWGLGLGIVQSLVRLMGGEIRIVDKENGEKGTCFRFSVFLTVCNPVSTVMDEDGNHMQNGVSSSDLLHYFELHIRYPNTRLEGSHVVLLLASKERRKISKRAIENIGIKVTVAETDKDLRRILYKIKEKMDHFQLNLHEKSESSPPDYLSASSNSNSGLNEGHSGATDGHEAHLPQRKSFNSKAVQNFILIVIDAAIGPSLEASAALSSFKRETRNLQCKVVYWDNSIIPRRNSRDVKEQRPLIPCDYILKKPLHGSGLYGVLRLLPVFHGAFPPESLIVKAEAVQENEGSSETTVPPNRLVKFSSNTELQNGKISTDEKQELQEIVIHDPAADQSSPNPLKGKSVLVVDDLEVLRRVASTRISKLGARVEVCENGKEAFDKVCKVLNDEKEINQETLPYDFIIMDCEMPVMDGYEATRLIRKEEKIHGIHIPIFALTAHAMPEEHRKIVDAGMDFHLCKPFDADKLMDAIRDIERKFKH
ncbi:histidine kinase CKI1-like [Coffea arabica]|uniref:histidine kinase n=1 Tax=Coffea arabica TaxID=13443 RepID=A0A6P6W3P1_COFAR